MEIVLLPAADEHLLYWQKKKRKTILKKISTLIKSILESPYSGIGKPEPLRYQLAGKWSRRIDSKNRIVYTIENNTLYIYSLKGHYE